MLKYVSFFLVLAVLGSCKSEEEEVIPEIESSVEDYQEDTVKHEKVNAASPGEFVEYYENGEIKMKGRYNNIMRMGSSGVKATT